VSFSSTGARTHHQPRHTPAQVHVVFECSHREEVRARLNCSLYAQGVKVNNPSAHAPLATRARATHTFFDICNIGRRLSNLDEHTCDAKLVRLNGNISFRARRQLFEKLDGKDLL